MLVSGSAAECRGVPSRAWEMGHECHRMTPRAMVCRHVRLQEGCKTGPPVKRPAVPSHPVLRRFSTRGLTAIGNFCRRSDCDSGSNFGATPRHCVPDDECGAGFHVGSTPWGPFRAPRRTRVEVHRQADRQDRGGELVLLRASASGPAAGFCQQRRGRAPSASSTFRASPSVCSGRFRTEPHQSGAGGGQDAATRPLHASHDRAAQRTLCGRFRASHGRLRTSAA